jgi:hypothetical protein
MTKTARAQVELLRSAFASSGGTARAKALTPERRKEIALKAGLANRAAWKKRKKQLASKISDE